MPPSHRPLAIALALALPGLAHAQQAPTPTQLDAVQVLGALRPLSRFPGAVDVLDGATLRDGQRAVNLSEALARVPGVSALDRGNYAQDLQVQSRGFGARSTFGIRGLKLVVDDIPASAPDGQGQVATFALDALDRVEVLRGPLALQYGNAAGGAIVGRSEPDGARALALDAWTGSDATQRAALRADGRIGRAAVRANASHFSTDGHRPHAAARRTQAGAVLAWQGTRHTVRVAANALHQPWTDDPLGLTRAAFDADPRGTDPVATQFDTRKRIDNRQAGVRWEHAATATRMGWLGAHAVARNVDQFLAVPIAAQAAASSAGGEIDLQRRTHGVEAGHRWTGTRGTLAVGVEAGDLQETRRGYENFDGTTLGVRGRLRRDERNAVATREAWAVGDARLGTWTLLAGVRHARLRFASGDRYLANGDDSGGVRYARTAASVGVARAFDAGEVFASVGRGFETPSVTELAYRPDGAAGFNADLRPARTTSAEIGLRWRAGGHVGSAAVYRVDGEDEIVPADSRGGRASFANAGATRRDGIEIGLRGPLGARWSYVLAANAIDARFVDAYRFRVAAGGAPVTRTVQAGNRIPGIPRADGYAELAWDDATGRWNAAAEWRAIGRIAIDDRNTDAAAGNARLALRGQWRGPRGWRAFARVDNAFDRAYAGSVIVNEANGRAFEPAAGRTWTLGLGRDWP